MRIPLPRFLRRSPRPAITRAQALGAVPVRNPLVEGQRGEKGLYLLKVPLRRDRRGRLMRWLFRLPEYHFIELDEVGSDVWEWCDGQRTLQDIATILMEKYRLHRREAELSLATFLQQLARKGLIGMALRPLSSQEWEEFRRRAWEAWERGRRPPVPSLWGEEAHHG